jgi:hypothetical protein
MGPAQMVRQGFGFIYLRVFQIGLNFLKADQDSFRLPLSLIRRNKLYQESSGYFRILSFFK